MHAYVDRYCAPETEVLEEGKANKKRRVVKKEPVVVNRMGPLWLVDEDYSLLWVCAPSLITRCCGHVLLPFLAAVGMCTFPRSSLYQPIICHCRCRRPSSTRSRTESTGSLSRRSSTTAHSCQTEPGPLACARSGVCVCVLAYPWCYTSPQRSNLCTHRYEVVVKPREEAAGDPNRRPKPVKVWECHGHYMPSRSLICPPHTDGQGCG